MENLLRELSSARVYDLEQPRYFGAPIFPSHAPGFVYTLHRRHEPDTGSTRTSASGVIYTAEHSGTHIDALSHQAENMTLYGGREINAQLQTGAGFSELGAETIPPLVGRGVLLDVARLKGVERVANDQPITRDDLEAAARQQGVEVREGDIVLVRIGNGTLWEDAEAYLAATGMTADASLWLAERRVRAVGADNVAWDVPGVVDPGLNITLPGHLILLVRNGIYIMENLYLEELAREQRYEFLFVCLPLKMRGATGSPVRPISIVSP